VLGALLELAGESAHAVAADVEETLDETWAEPPVFDGCTSKGQARPGAPQPIQVIHRKAQPEVAAGAAMAPAASVGVQR